MKGYGLCTGSILGVTHCGAIALQKIILISVHLRYEKWCSLEQIAAQTPILSRNIAKREKRESPRLSGKWIRMSGNAKEGRWANAVAGEDTRGHGPKRNFGVTQPQFAVDRRLFGNFRVFPALETKKTCQSRTALKYEVRRALIC